MSTFQYIFITIYTIIVAWDYIGPQTQITSAPVFIGLFIGLAFGDLKTGLAVGGSLQLMSMGVVGLAGASVPSYTIAALIAVPLAIVTGGGYEAGLAIGIPVGMLDVQLDIMKKIGNGFIARISQNYCNKGQFAKMNNILYLTIFLEILKYLVPVLIALLLGVQVVEAALEILPDWFMGGLSVAGKVLPVVGMAILLNYMPTKKHVNYLIIGFVLYAYLNVPMLGCALVGFAFAFKFYKDKIETLSNPTMAGGLEDE